MVTAPVMVFLYDRCFLAGTFRDAWRRRGRFHLALAATWLLLLYLLTTEAWSRGGAGGFGKNVGAWDYLLLQSRALVHYLRLALWPHPLCFDYGVPTVVRLGQAALPGLAILAALAATVWALRRNRPAGFLGAWFFLILAPSSSIVPLATQTMAEHRMYLPLAAPIAGAVLGAHALLGRRRLWWWIVPAIALAAATAGRNEVYRTPEALWSDTLRRAPGNARARNNLGLCLLDGGRIPEAVELLESAVRIEPDSASAQNNLGLALWRAGRSAAALGHLREAVALDPNFARARYNFGTALAASGGREEAVDQFEAALRLEPDSADARNALAGQFLAEGRVAEAIAQFEAVLRLDPASPGTEYDLGVAYERAGDRAEAIAHYEAAVRLEPDSVSARTNLGSALARDGRYEEAARQFEAALRIDPSYGPAQRNLERVREIEARP